MSAEYVYMSGRGFAPDPQEPVMQSIFREYERVVIESLIMSFGLDEFIKDRHGGDVDTIHNVRQIGVDERMTYKNKANEEAYVQHGEYDSYEYHQDPRYRAKNKEVSQQKKNGTLIDDYTGERIPPNGRTNLDHTISAKEIHDDRGRVLAGLRGVDLANSSENLHPTNEHTNKSKNAHSMDEYLKRHGDEYTEAQKENMHGIDAEARKSYEKKLAVSYYTSPGFAKDLTKVAGKRAAQMGVRHALGLVFAEMWFAVKEEFNAAGLRDHFDLGEFFRVIGRGLRRGFENAKKKYKELLAKLMSGAVAGAVASLTTTLCNIFATTAKNVVRIIRQSYASLVEAAKVLFINPQDYPFGERMRAVVKILATGASVIVGTLVSEALKDTPVGMIPIGGEIVTTFCGSLVTGIMSCTLLMFLDRSELINKLVRALNNMHTVSTDVAYFKRQAVYFEQYAAKLMKIDLKKFQREAAIYGSAAESIDKATTETELNSILKDIYSRLGLKTPWDENISFDEFMREDSDRTLVFGRV